MERPAAHLLRARLAAAPTADEVDGGGALRNALHVGLVQVIQLVGQAGARWLLAPTLQPTHQSTPHCPAPMVIIDGNFAVWSVRAAAGRMAVGSVRPVGLSRLPPTGLEMQS